MEYTAFALLNNTSVYKPVMIAFDTNVVTVKQIALWCAKRLREDNDNSICRYVIKHSIVEKDDDVVIWKNNKTGKVAIATRKYFWRKA